MRKIRAMAMSVDGVSGTGRIRTRQVGQNLWVDLDILVSSKCSVEKASLIADKVRGHMLRKAKHVEDVVVYYYAEPRAGRAGLLGRQPRSPAAAGQAATPGQPPGSAGPWSPRTSGSEGSLAPSRKEKVR